MFDSGSYNLNRDLDVTKTGTLNIYKDADKIDLVPVLNFNNQTGFKLTDNTGETTLNISGIKLINTKRDGTDIVDTTNGAFITAGEKATVNLDNVEINTIEANAIVNDGKLNFTAGDSISNSNIAGTNGALKIVHDATLTMTDSASITQKDINIDGALFVEKGNVNGTVNIGSADCSGLMTVAQGNINGDTTITNGDLNIETGAINGKLTIKDNGTATMFADSLTQDVTNSGTLHLLGNSLDYVVDGTSGMTYIDGAVTNNKAINQSVVVADNGNLTVRANIQSLTNNGQVKSNASFLTDDVTNNGDLALDGGDLTHAVHGDGITSIIADTSNSAGITQAVNILSGATLTNNADLGAEDAVIANNGTLNTNADFIKGLLKNNNELVLSGGVLDKDIEGTGITTIAGSVVNNAQIGQNLKVMSDAVFESSLDTLTSIENNGQFITDSGILDKTIRGTGTTTFTNNLIIDNGEYLAPSQNIIADGIVVLNNTNATVNNAVFNNVLNLDENTLTAQNVTLSDALRITINSLTDDAKGYAGGQLIVHDTLTLENQAKVQLNIAAGLLKDGQSTDLAIVSALNKENSWNDIFEENLRYTIRENADGTFKVTNAKAVADLDMNRNNINTGIAWENVDVSLGADIANIHSELNYLSQFDIDKYKKELSNIAPSDNQLTIANILEINNTINRNIERNINRYNQGINSGDLFNDRNVWINAITSTSRQSGSFEHAGFDADTKGTIFGADGRYNEDIRLGFGYAYHHTDVDSSSRDTDIKGHTLFVYGKYQPKQQYVRGMLTYNSADYKEHTSVVSMPLNSKYDVHGGALELYTGMPDIYGYQGITPEFGGRYNHLKRDKYHDSLGQKVKTNDIDILTAVFDVKYDHEYKINDIVLKPRAHAGVTYDIVSDDNKATVNIGNASYIINGERLSRLGFETGMEFTVEKDNWEFGLGYDMEIRNHYNDHSGNLSVKYHF